MTKANIFTYLLLLFFVPNIVKGSDGLTHKNVRLNTNETVYDAIIIPGYPCDGISWNLTVKMRLLWAKYLFDNGLAKNIIVFYSFTAVLFFLLAAKGFNHHLIFFIFFISINYKKVHLHKVKGTLFGLILIFMMIQVSNYQKTEYRDMFNLNNLENSYSLKNLSQEIDRYFINDYTVLALDYNLLLFYLNKPNYSYVIHPTNHFEPWIRESLISVNKISEVNVIRMIDEKPDVIICSHMSIAQGLVDNEYFNCEVSDYYPEYTKLDTSAYKENRKREYYFDPYKDISVFVKMRK